MTSGYRSVTSRASPQKDLSQHWLEFPNSYLADSGQSAMPDFTAEMKPIRADADMVSMPAAGATVLHTASPATPVCATATQPPPAQKELFLKRSGVIFVHFCQAKRSVRVLRIRSRDCGSSGHFRNMLLKRLRYLFTSVSCSSHESPPLSSTLTVLRSMSSSN